MAWSKNDNFIYGEVGNRLDALRDKAEFQNSAKEIENMYVTESGSLRIMKQWDSTTLDNTTPILAALETRYHFFIAITEDEIMLVRNKDNHVLSRIHSTLTFDEHYNFTVFDKNNLGCVKCITDDDGVTQSGQEFLQFETDGTNIVYTTFMDDLMLPFTNQEQVIIDVHIVQREKYVEKTDPSTGAITEGERKVIVKLSDSMKDPQVSFLNGVMIIKELAGPVKRVYANSTGLFIVSDGTPTSTTGNIDVNGIDYGDLIVNFHGGLPDPLVFGKFEIEPEATLTDAVFSNMQYYDKFQPVGQTPAELTGLEHLYSGDIVTLKDNLAAISVFQDRLVLCSQDSIYFSKVHDYDNFTESSHVDSPFSITPNPIVNKQPVILGSYSSRGLFIVTDRGIYSIGYNTIITANAKSISTITDMPATNKIAMIDYNFYFVGQDNYIYAIQEQTQATTSRLYQYIVEKYDIKHDVKNISVIRLDKKNRLLVTTSTDKVYMYIAIENDTFSRVSFELPNNGKLIGLYDIILDNNKVLEYSTKNYPNARVKVHQPSLFKEASGTLLCDDNSPVQVCSAYIINEKTADANGDLTVSGIKSVIINNKRSSNNGKNTGLALKYSVKITFNIGEGFYYEFETTEGEGIIELEATEYQYKIGGRY